LGRKRPVRAVVGEEEGKKSRAPAELTVAKGKWLVRRVGADSGRR
jgi:hypothetical protein